MSVWAYSMTWMQNVSRYCNVKLSTNSSDNHVEELLIMTEFKIMLDDTWEKYPRLVAIGKIANTNLQDHVLQM